MAASPRGGDEESQSNDSVQYEKKPPKEQQQEFEMGGATGLIPDELTLNALGRSVRRDVTKTRRYRTFPCYLFFLLCFSLLIGLEQLSGDDRYYMTNSVRTLVNGDGFEQIHTPQDWYSWIKPSLRRMWQQLNPATAIVALDRNVPLGFVLLRQWRVRPQQCESPQVNAISRKSRQLLPLLCYLDYDGGELDTQPYGPGLRWKSTRAMEHSVTLVGVTGQLFTYNELDKAFPVYLYLNDTLQSTLDTLNTLETNGWIDASTRAVTVDLLFFNPNLASFELVHLIMEMDSTGDVIPTVKSNFFRYMRHDESAKAGFLFFLDIVVFLFTVGFIVDLWLTVRNQYRLEGTIWGAVGLWELYMTIAIVIMVLTSAYRFWLWTRGMELGESWAKDNAGDYGGDEDKLMMQSAADYVSKQQVALMLLAWLAILVWLRVFEFLQFNERLNLVTETMVRSLGQLIAMVIIFIIILLGFSMAGKLFYGHTMYEFRTFLDTAGYLLRLVFSAEFGEYLDLDKIRPVITPLYILLFFILTWLILLNMILAIIAGSFSALQERAKMSRGWSAPEIWRDFQKATNRMVPQEAKRRWSHWRKKPEPEDREAVQLQLLPRLRQRQAEARGLPGQGDKEVFVTKTDFMLDCREIMSKETAERIYKKAATDIVGPQERTFRLGERFAYHLNKRLLKIEAQIRGQQGNIDRIPAIEKASVHQHIQNLQPKIERLNELQEDIRRELFQLHHAIPVHFGEVHSDLSHQMANLEQLTTQRIAPPLQALHEGTRKLHSEIQTLKASKGARNTTESTELSGARSWRTGAHPSIVVHPPRQGSQE